MPQTAQEWRPSWGGVGAPVLAETNTTAQYPLGSIIGIQSTARGAGEAIYLKGLALTAVGSWITYNADDYSTTLLAANAIGPVAISLSANVANQYGWYIITGKPFGLALTGFADNANVYATGTAGSVDDTAVTGDRVWHAKGASALDTLTGGADFEIHRPFVNDALNAGTGA